jgi:hypothetical protein
MQAYVIMTVPTFKNKLLMLSSAACVDVFFD